jgi:hypothetical protein
MNTQASTLAVLAIHMYDDNMLIFEKYNRCEQQAKNTCRPDFPPQEERGPDFQPLHIEYRNFTANQLLHDQVALFKHFMPL